ncbi:hypothetical protein [Cupriavidus sp. BIC8F]|uniref:hypothetical protein n=1 Tax=Cupriavidus sp. BIC8F TaxID=3079014 RepID=UPI002916EC65|nr:hypothetical protein [Cupriavidus sp. BIC8F]
MAAITAILPESPPMPPVSTPARHLSSSRARWLRWLALAAGAPVSLLCVASLFGMQAGLLASWQAWWHADASLAMIALGTLVAGFLLALCTGDQAANGSAAARASLRAQAPEAAAVNAKRGVRRPYSRFH